MKELDKFLQNTKEITFMEFLDIYSDLEIGFHKDHNLYTFIFPEVDSYSEIVTTLKIDSKGHLIESSCNCHSDGEGYCVHELGAFIKYLEMKNPKFDIIEYLMKEESKGNENIWLEPMVFDDEFGDEFDITPEEMAEIMDFDVGSVFEEMTKSEIIDFLRDLTDTYPVARFAILQHLADITLSDVDIEDILDEDEIDSFQAHLFSKTHKPS